MKNITLIISILFYSTSLYAGNNIQRSLRRQDFVESIRSGNTEQVQIFINKAKRDDLNHLNEDIDIGQYLNTMLYWAAQNEHAGVVQLLLDGGADVNAASRTYDVASGKHIEDNAWTEGFTPLHYSAWKGQVEVAKVLLDNKANINAVVRGHTALDLFMESYNKPDKAELIVFLRSKGAKSIRELQNNPETVLRTEPQPLQPRSYASEMDVVVKQEPGLEETQQQHEQFLSELTSDQIDTVMKIIRGQSSAQMNCVHLADAMLKYFDTELIPTAPANESDCTLDDWTSSITSYCRGKSVKKENVPFKASADNFGEIRRPLVPISFQEKEDGSFEAFGYDLTKIDEPMVLPSVNFKDLKNRLASLANSSWNGVSYGLVNLLHKDENQPGHMLVYFINRNGLFFIDGQRIMAGHGSAIFSDFSKEYQRNGFVPHAVYLELYPN